MNFKLSKLTTFFFLPAHTRKKNAILNAMKTLKVLVAEDTASEFATIRDYLMSLHVEGCKVEVVRTNDGQKAFSLMRDEDFALVILDVCLPHMDGHAILKSIRRQKPFLPIVAVSSFQGDIGEADTLNEGADDFLSKPFSERTFHARVKKALWHGRLATIDKESSWGHVRMNVDTRSATYRGVHLDLSELEFNILLQLVRAQGQVVEANALERTTWGDVERFSMRLANKIKTLRNKFEALGAPRDIIDTNRGMGYVLREC